MYLLDTNICVFLMKNKYPSLTERLLELNPIDVAISSVTLYELEYGATKSRWGDSTRDKLYTFIAPFTVIPFDANDAICAGNLRAYLAERGEPIGPYDTQIAAQGLARNMTIVTHNAAEFSRVPNLKVEDWIRPS